MKIKMPDTSILNDYYKSYLKYVQTDDLLEFLIKQKESARKFLAAVPSEKETFRYADGKWSVREIAGHLCDTERILSYRALRFARNDNTPLEGFEENHYASNSNYNDIPLSEINHQLEAIRESNICFFKSLDDIALDRGGKANNNPVTVRSLLFFIVGHEEHHLGVIRDRYLS
jgi:uncharacterized damage-inducible protein DinB